MKTAEQELEAFLDRKSRLFEQAMLNWLRAKFHGKGDEENALRDLARLIRDTLILSDLHGRRRTLLERDHLAKGGEFSGIPDRNPIVYGVTFDEALEDLLTREPRLAKSAEEVSRLYSQEHVFALAKSASMKLTERVQQAVQALIEEGETAGKTENEILRIAAEESHDWTRAYAGTVYQTNVSNAYSEGRFRQVKDPEVRAVIPAFEVVGVGDDRERENHRFARGLIAGVDDPVWLRAKPPYGYRCRHGLAFVSKYTLERRGLLRADGSVIRYEPPGFDRFHPDPGFNQGGF